MGRSTVWPWYNGQLKIDQLCQFFKGQCCHQYAVTLTCCSWTIDQLSSFVVLEGKVFFFVMRCVEKWKLCKILFVPPIDSAKDNTHQGNSLMEYLYRRVITKTYLFDGISILTCYHKNLFVDGTSILTCYHKSFLTSYFYTGGYYCESCTIKMSE